jgi:hypothetical protein
MEEEEDKKSIQDITCSDYNDPSSLLIDIDCFDGQEISTVIFLVGGKEYRFSTNQISLFFDHITEGFLHEQFY